MTSRAALLQNGEESAVETDQRYYTCLACRRLALLDPRILEADFALSSAAEL